MLDLSKVWPELKVIEKLGEGSFGKVYKCEREELGMKLYNAVKVISIPQSGAEIDSLVSDGFTDEQIKAYYSDIVESFANEIKLLFMLKGAPNIVSVESYKIVERQDKIGWDIYILMEYLESFTKYSQGKKLVESDIRALALDMCTALKNCAKYNIIHRDIKPANIFVDRFGSFKLGDFSIAKQLEGTMDFMSQKGTFGYMAPEVYHGESYDFRADVYSLGRVLYKLLNRNREPFVDVNKEFISFKDRNESFERIKRGEKLPAPVDASPSMAAVILKACEPNPENRFSSIEELKTAFEAVGTVLEDFTVAAKDYFEMTVAARDFELPKPFNEKATSIQFDEPTVFAGDDATAIASVDPEATVIADDGFNGAEAYPRQTVQGSVDSSFKSSANYLANASVGDYITFGSYEQDNNCSNGKEPIEWLVLEKFRGRMFVISRYALDCKMYNEKYEAATWESCSLREWLNGEFFYNAFTESEAAQILTVTVKADENPSYKTDPGRTTWDKLFLLSAVEAKKYFNSDSERICSPTDYAIAQGTWKSKLQNNSTSCFWRLRSPGATQEFATTVGYSGSVYNSGLSVNFSSDAVRPAMWIAF